MRQKFDSNLDMLSNDVMCFSLFSYSKSTEVSKQFSVRNGVHSAS
jgi:hypothetical protein